MSFLNDIRTHKTTLNDLAQEYKKTFFSFILDSVLCRVIHGATVQDYLGLSMYKLSFAERKRVVTQYRSERIEKLFNTFYIEKRGKEKSSLVSLEQ